MAVKCKSICGIVYGHLAQCHIWTTIHSDQWLSIWSNMKSTDDVSRVLYLQRPHSWTDLTENWCGVLLWTQMKSRISSVISILPRIHYVVGFLKSRGAHSHRTCKVFCSIMRYQARGLSSVLIGVFFTLCRLQCRHAELGRDLKYLRKIPKFSLCSS